MIVTKTPSRREVGLEMGLSGFQIRPDSGPEIADFGVYTAPNCFKNIKIYNKPKNDWSANPMLLLFWPRRRCRTRRREPLRRRTPAWQKGLVLSLRRWDPSNRGTKRQHYHINIVFLPDMLRDRQ